MENSANNYNLSKLGKTEVDSNEEKLLLDSSVVSFSSEGAIGSKIYYVGIDCGSTQTRVTMVSHDDLSQENLDNFFSVNCVVPSVSKSIPFDRQLTYKSSALIDRLDSSFSVNNKELVRVVRGPKTLEFETKQNEFIASERKVDSTSLYYNIVDSIGYGLIQHSIETGVPVPSVVDLYLAIALPPDDLRMSTALSKIKSELQTVSWTWCSKKPINMRIKDFRMYSEPECQIKAYYSLAGEEMPEEVLIVELGGRNGSTTVLINGAVIEQTARSIEQSGSQLLTQLGDECVIAFGGKPPATRHLMHALKTGNLKIGDDYVDIVDIIKRCKISVAENLFHRIQSEVISRQTSLTSLTSLNIIVLGGRMFDSGAYDYSISQRFGELLHEVSPRTKCVVLPENFISRGAALMYMSEAL